MDKRHNKIFVCDEGEYMITIFNPSSNEYGEKLIVIYEDAFGDINMNLMTPKAIINNYDIQLNEIDKFIDEIKEHENEE